MTICPTCSDHGTITVGVTGEWRDQTIDCTDCPVCSLCNDRVADGPRPHRDEVTGDWLCGAPECEAEFVAATRIASCGSGQDGASRS